MSITIENPTADAFYEALKHMPQIELERLKKMLGVMPSIDESSEWSEEDFRDLNRYTAKLIDERFGPEEGNYD